MTLLEAFGLVACIALGGGAGYLAGAFVKGIWEDSDPSMTPAWVLPLSIVLATVGVLAGAAIGTYFAVTT